MIHFINLLFIFIAALGLCGLSACGLTSSVKVITSVGACPSGSIESGCAAESSKVLSLTSRRPLVIKSGDTVALTGTGFNKAMSATVGGIAVTSLEVTSATAASLVVPAGVATGMSELKLALNTAEAKASMAYTPANDIPLMTVAVSEVCAGVAFYDINGDRQTGTKVCTVDMSNIVAGNIKTGVTIAGVAGNVTLPAASDVKSGSTSYGVAGTQFTPSYSADFPDVANVKTTDTVNGASGTLDLTNLLAGNIKRGVAIGAVTGNYPSATSPLLRYSDDGATTNISGADETDLTSFATQVKTAGTFEFWDSSGVRRTGSGDADIVAGNIKDTVAFENLSVTGTFTGGGAAPSAWDLRAGVTVGVVTGKLKVNCRNSINNTYYNYNGAVASIPATGVTTGTTYDIWDTIDDYFGQPASTGFPAAWSVTNNYCGGVESVVDDDKAWKDITTTAAGAPSTCTVDGARCTMKDKISGLEWSKTIQNQSHLAAGDQRLRRPDPQRSIRLASANAEGANGRLRAWGYKRSEYELDHDRADARKLFLGVVDPIRHLVHRVARVPVVRVHGQL